ncbi:Uncharacterised protein [Shigella sonnei]|nr:Uncharacterised protein [Shigella sonnei]CSR74037.1 Uncharacterised protein [Shigella sonnei]
MSVLQKQAKSIRQTNIINRRTTPQTGTFAAFLLQFLVPFAQRGFVLLFYNTHSAASCFFSLAALALCFSADVVKYFLRAVMMRSKSTGS